MDMNDLRGEILGDRYKLLKKIAHGGMGLVYKALDLRENRILALKILSERLNKTESAQRFRQEFKTMSRLNHSNLCRVFDYGTTRGGEAYFTMEYLEGKDIYTVAQNYPLSKVYPLIIQVCRALEYIHSMGLIHCDLKPNNIIVSKESVKLIDFGLAQEIKLGNTTLRGTFPYIAPEVIKGLPIDHRVDIYSLGVIFYEILTKKLLSSNMRKKITTAFLREYLSFIENLPMLIDSYIPKNLRKLLKEMTAFQPENRFSTANDVIKAINEINGRSFELEIKSELKSYSLNMPFVGRKEDLELMKDSLKKNAGIFLIGGRTGYGKSRLLVEFKSYAQFEGAQVFFTYAYKNIGSLGLFCKFFKELNSCYKDIIDKKTLTALSLFYQELSDATGITNPLQHSSQYERIRMFDILLQLIEKAARKIGKMAIFLEDLHLADEESLLFLTHLGRNISGLNIYLYGTYRSEEEYSNPKLSKLIEELNDSPYFKSITLKPFGIQETRELLGLVFPEIQINQKLVQRFVQETGGNPFFIEEIIKTFIVQKGTRQIDESIFEEISIPKNIEDFLLKRLEGLTPEALNVVKLASAFRKNFTLETIESIIKKDVNAIFSELRQHGLLRQEKGECFFNNNSLKEAVYNSISESEKREIHLKIAEFLEPHYKKNLNILDEVAFHYLNSGSLQKLRFGLYAGAEYSKKGFYKEAARFYEMALKIVPKGDQSRISALFRILGDTYLSAISYSNAISSYKNALAIGTSNFYQKYSIYERIGLAYDRMENIPMSLKYYKMALMLTENKNRPLLRAKALVDTALALTKLGKQKDAQGLILAAMDILKKFESIKADRNTLITLAKIYSTLGNIEYIKGSPDNSRIFHEKSLEYINILGDENKIADIISQIGNTYLSKGEYDIAIKKYQEAHKIYQKLKNPAGDKLTLLHLGAGYFYKNNIPLAISSLRKAMEIGIKYGLPNDSECINLGNCYQIMCEYQKAKQYYSEALQFLKKTGNKYQVTILLSNIAALSQAMGDYGEALRILNSLLLDLRNKQEFENESYCLYLLGEIFVDLNRFPKAQKCLERALNIASPHNIAIVKIAALSSLCKLALFTKDEQKFLEYFKEGLELTQKTKMKLEEADYLRLLSEFNYLQNEYVQGIENSKKALEILEKVNGKDVYYARGLISLVKNMLKHQSSLRIKELKYIEEALALAEKYPIPENKWKAYFIYASYCKDEGNFVEAIRYLKKAINIFQAVCEKIPTSTYKESYLCRTDRQEVFRMMDEIEDIVRNR